MGFGKKLQYFLVKNLLISNKEAQKLLLEKKIKVNGKITCANIEIEAEDTILKGENVLQQGQIFKYLAYYKPRGIETTLNTEIESNLISLLPEPDVFPIGRLDKESEGLLILTNDGRQYDRILRKESKTEKEYLVTVDKQVTDEFVENMQSGIKIMGKMTLPCTVIKIDQNRFKIILIQGLNRQIRRMCYKMGYEVKELIRIRIGKVELSTLRPGEFKKLIKSDLESEVK